MLAEVLQRPATLLQPDVAEVLDICRFTREDEAPEPPPRAPKTLA
jgi:hypothetical protein